MYKKLPSQPSNPCVTQPPSTSFGPPMAKISVDLFDHSGKSHLICVDRWSSFPLYKRLSSLSTQSVINILCDWFNILGWPLSIHSDRGPQFGSSFTAWCTKNNIIHELSAPYNPKSNGQAESAIKNVKYLLSKCLETGQDADRALYEWRNVNKADGYSPAQLLFGKKQYTFLPAAASHFSFYDIDIAKEVKDKKFDQAR